jgi:hypothetical protein
MGAAVVWLWGREMEEYEGERTRRVRTKAADGVRVVEETAGAVLDRGGDALRRARRVLAGHEAACHRGSPGRGGSDSPGGGRQRSMTAKRDSRR